MRVLHKFIPNKSFRELLDISPKHFTCLKKFNSDYHMLKYDFPDQNSKPLEKKDENKHYISY